MKVFQGYRWFASLIALVCLFGLNGCNSLRDSLNGDDAINYRSVVRADPLSIPPDLTQAAGDPRYKAPAGSTTYSQYQQSQVAAKSPQEVARASAVLPQRNDMRIERDGDLRWLVIDMPPDQAFSKVSDFWTESGFVLDVVDPKAGLLVTNWAENRAKIPESWIRQALGSILDGLWDSGTRDKFRTRIERSTTPGRTEIYISHQHMEEVASQTSTKTDVRWMNGREDPGLNAAMLARLMVFLGEDIDGARHKMAQAQRSPQEPKVAAPVAGDKTALVISESFERAWRRVGVALDSGGFSVDDRDRSAGDYYVRYVDTDTGAKREDPGFFSRLFGAKQTAPAQQFRIHLTAQGDKTEVTILDANGKRDTSPTAARIIDVLGGKI